MRGSRNLRSQSRERRREVAPARGRRGHGYAKRPCCAADAVARRPSATDTRTVGFAYSQVQQVVATTRDGCGLRPAPQLATLNLNYACPAEVGEVSQRWR